MRWVHKLSAECGGGPIARSFFSALRVPRRRAPEDRRRHALFLTRAGQAKLANAREASRERGEELITPLSDREAQSLHDLLERIASADELDLRPGADWD
jgi:hypothetical protein